MTTNQNECTNCFEETDGTDLLCARCSWLEGLAPEEQREELRMIDQHVAGSEEAR